MPAFLVVWWSLWGVGWLWRRTVWARIGDAARALAGPAGPAPVWAGWKVRGDGFTVVWRGGALGDSTVVVGPGGRRRARGLLDEAAVRELVRR